MADDKAEYQRLFYVGHELQAVKMSASIERDRDSPPWLELCFSLADGRTVAHLDLDAHDKGDILNTIQALLFIEEAAREALVVTTKFREEIE